MFNSIRKFILKDLINRTNDMETAIYVLLNDPAFKVDLNVGFNGQVGRTHIFTELLNNYEFKCLIETGTYLGNTTGYMATKSSIPVHSCEFNKTIYFLARMRLKEIPTVTLYNMDSRDFLKEISEKKEITQSESFIYLDAHWGKDRPLKEEVTLIAERWEKFIVMVDDFQVPDDDGYGYDRYGPLKKLNLSLLRPVLKKFDLCVYFPSLPSEEESGGRRGSVIIARNNDYTDPLKQMTSLRSYKY